MQPEVLDVTLMNCNNGIVNVREKHIGGAILEKS